MSTPAISGRLGSPAHGDDTAFGTSVSPWMRRFAAPWPIVGVAVAGAASMLTALPAAASAPAPTTGAMLLACLLLSVGDVSLLHVRFGRDHHSYTLAEIALVVTLVVIPGPWLPLLAPAAVAASHMVARRPSVKVAFNAFSSAAGVLLAQTAYVAIMGVRDDLPAHAVALAAASLTYFIWNTVTMSAAVASTQGLAFRAVYRRGLLLSLIVWAGNTAVGLLLVVLGQTNPLALLVVPALLGMLYLAYRSYLRAMHERDVWHVLQDATGQLLGAAEVARVVMARTPPLFGADFVELLLVDDESAATAATYRWSADAGMANVQETLMRPGHPFWGRVLAEREPFLIVQRHAATAQRMELSQLGLSTCAVAPLMIQGECAGALRIGFSNEPRISPRQLQILSTFANHVSAALHNTKLFAAMRTQALHDPLTGLANRTVLLDRLEHAQARANSTSSTIAAIFLDLDRFKVINDSLGHDAGDLLLVSVAERIKGGLRPGDVAARFGGDEFVVLCDDVAGPIEALAIAQRIAATLESPFALRGETVFVTASVGVAVTGQSREDAAGVLRDADAAMYEAKGRGPDRCVLFDKGMRERALARLEMESDLRRAIDGEQLCLHYQPNIRLADHGIVGVEALLRWEHPVHGLVPPSKFIPLAEETGLIVSIGAWVIETACKQLAEWSKFRSGDEEELYLAINLSAHQLTHPGLVKDVAAALMSTGVRPQSICFEVTETALVDDAVQAREVLERLRSLGIRIALDDFGTGYSSLSYLHTLPVDVLKLDRSFVARLGPDPRDGAVVAGIIDLAHALDLTVVAEGVETCEQLETLGDLSCDLVQGNHFCAPQAAADICDVLFPQHAGGRLFAVESAEASVAYEAS